MEMYTKTNPWKTYPKNLPCFCGSGEVAKECGCTRLMPQWITTKDERQAKFEMAEVVVAVRKMKLQGKTYIDLARAKKMRTFFEKRDLSEADREKLKRARMAGSTRNNNDTREGDTTPGAETISSETPASKL